MTSAATFLPAKLTLPASGDFHVDVNLTDAADSAVAERNRRRARDQEAFHRNSSGSDYVTDVRRVFERRRAPPRRSRRARRRWANATYML